MIAFTFLFFDYFFIIIIFIFDQMKMYELVQACNITKLCFPDLWMATWFFEFKWDHFTNQVGRVSDGLNLLLLAYFTL